MQHLGTAQQLAAMIVEGADSFPGPRFIISVYGTGDMQDIALRVQFGEHARTLCSTRDVSTPRSFSTVDTAIRTARSIATLAGHEDDHRWTGEAERLAVMPEISVEIL